MYVRNIYYRFPSISYLYVRRPSVGIIYACVGLFMRMEDYGCVGIRYTERGHMGNERELVSSLASCVCQFASCTRTSGKCIPSLFLYPTIYLSISLLYREDVTYRTSRSFVFIPKRSRIIGIFFLLFLFFFFFFPFSSFASSTR